jgi:hypothetical protein
MSKLTKFGKNISIDSGKQEHLLPNIYRPCYENANKTPLPIRASSGKPGVMTDYNIDLHKMRRSMLSVTLGPASLETDRQEIEIDKILSKQYKHIIHWFPTDNKENFEQHIKNEDEKGLLKKLGWYSDDGNHKKIKYKFNEQGFRAKNFDQIDRKCILFAGCSQTFGIGVNLEQTFSSIVSEYFNKECVNLGIPGKGIDVHALYFSLFLNNEIDVSLVDAVVVYLPPPGRVARFTQALGKLDLNDLNGDPIFFTNKYQEQGIPEMTDSQLNDANKVFNITPYTSTEEINLKLDAGFDQHINNHRSRSLEHFILTKENILAREISAINSIKVFCLENNIPLIVKAQSWEKSVSSDLARDLAHHGPNTHNSIAQQIISDLNPILG